MIMDTKEALQVVRALADGVDPCTGEVFPDDSPYQHPRVVRALFAAVRALEESESRRAKEERHRIEKQLPDNAGKSWERREDEELIIAFEAGMKIKEMAHKHQRTEGSIQSRLVKLGKIQLPNVLP